KSKLDRIYGMVKSRSRCHYGQAGIPKCDGTRASVRGRTCARYGWRCAARTRASEGICGTGVSGAGVGRVVSPEAVYAFCGTPSLRDPIRRRFPMPVRLVLRIVGADEYMELSMIYPRLVTAGRLLSTNPKVKGETSCLRQLSRECCWCAIALIL